MVLKSIELIGFKSFAKKTTLLFDSPVTGIVGPNGSGKSNVVEAIRFVLGEQSIKSLRGKGGSDLIFKGSKTLSPLSRALVTIVFDNKNKQFSFGDTSDTKVKLLSYDEVRIGREVFSDGSNVYKINDTEVRLKDIVELLSSVNIGASGHHIISQGEADRILSANTRDRRIMIEDALGLKIYQFRIKETERRLDKTEDNIKEITALKRELAPHLVYLKKQVEKIEKASTLRFELIDLYTAYIKNEYSILAQNKQTHIFKKQDLMTSYRTVSDLFTTLAKNKNTEFVSQFQGEYDRVVHSINEHNRLKNELERSLGRLEGTKEALSITPQTKERKEKLIPHSIVKKTFDEITGRLVSIVQSTDISFIHTTARDAQLHILQNSEYLEDKEIEIEQIDNSEHIEKINHEIVLIEQKIKDLEYETHSLMANRTEIEQKIADERKNQANNDKEYYEVQSKKESLEIHLRSVEDEEMRIVAKEEQFETELREGVALLGTDMPTFSGSIEDAVLVDIHIQDDLRRKIERVKIKLEESGGLGGSDTMKEYEATKTRDEFLASELFDLNNSITELRKLIADLKVRLDTDFKNGIEKINDSFANFFSLMFGGGTASLSLSVEHKRKKKDEDEIDEVALQTGESN
jgi:chromosome segregation protein